MRDALVIALAAWLGWSLRALWDLTVVPFRKWRKLPTCDGCGRRLAVEHLTTHGVLCSRCVLR